MPRKKPMKKPVIKLGPLTIRAIKGEPGAWLWRAEFYPSGGGGKMRTQSMSRGRGDRYGRDEAMNRAAQLLADGIHLEPSQAASPMRAIETVKDLLEAWLGHLNARVGGDLRPGSFRAYRTSAKRIGALPLASMRLKAVSAVHISVATRQLRASFADSTVSQTHVALRMCWLWGKREGIVHRGFPGKVWSRTPGHQHMPSVDDVLRTLDQMRVTELDGEETRLPIRQTQAILATEWMLYTGARPGEVSLVQVEDLDFERNTWLVREGEGSKTGERLVPMHSDLMERIRRYIATHLRDPLDGFWPPLASARGTTTSWAKRIRRAAEESGVRPWTPKGLRHLAVTRMLASGIDVATAASITGHSAEVLLRSYAHVLNDRRQAAVQALAPPAGKVVPFRKPG